MPGRELCTLAQSRVPALRTRQSCDTMKNPPTSALDYFAALEAKLASLIATFNPEQDDEEDDAEE